MKFDIPEQQCRQAKVPHELFLTNLIGNHILWFVASLGLAKSYWQPLALVPLVSAGILIYTLWRARRSRQIDEWFVMCHWQICADRSRLFIYMWLFFFVVAAFGWVGYTYLGMMEVAVYALVGGIGLLPIMVTVLVLILMESDILHQAAEQKLPGSILERFPNSTVKVLEVA